jgi:hypothetical protein
MPYFSLYKYLLGSFSANSAPPIEERRRGMGNSLVQYTKSICLTDKCHSLLLTMDKQTKKQLRDAELGYYRRLR